MDTSADKVSFVKIGAAEAHKFDDKAFEKFITGLTFKDFFVNPTWPTRIIPVTVQLDAPSNPMSNGIFSVDFMDKYSYAVIHNYTDGMVRIPIKYVDDILSALTKVRDGFNAAREAGERDFPKPVGYDEWKAAQYDNKYVEQACATFN